LSGGKNTSAPPSAEKNEFLNLNLMTCHLFYKSEKNNLDRINIVAIIAGLDAQL